MVLSLVGQALLAEPVRITLLDGSISTVELSAIDETGHLVGEGLPKNVQINDLRSIERQDAAIRTSPVPVIVELVGNARVRASGVKVANDVCEIAWSLGQAVKIPLDLVQGIRFDPAGKDASFEHAIANQGDDDLLFLKGENGVESIPGLIEELTADVVVFDHDGETVKFKREKLFGIVLASLGDQPLKGKNVTVELRDGSSLHATSVTYGDNVLKVRFSKKLQVQIPWTSVVGLRVRSNRLAFASDLKPVRVEQQSIVTESLPWQRDLSVGKRTLKLSYNEGRDTREFAKGLGTHSRCLLSFKIDSAYNLFAATIGIDAETQGRGDCVFVVLGDGKELYRQRVSGHDEPRDVQVDVAGIDQVTLLVEPGVELDLADHADWCDARFIRLKE